ncbi:MULTISPECIES: type II secretion system F family protein [unclassified Variovorax]|uniref:type II secretion system F family protein n=1 Tax=unclassified Variovorax TaxID=663243 RepID=UPI002577D530|nr:MULTISPECIES: type II secretion system F family protein [unclassified Variovorax]MDM0087706.1 type II secretion system F family protein [Variovorax sp. J22G40]MDM0144037.1 type II secretion system F family protein [Variovorax sp. J2P1-31]
MDVPEAFLIPAILALLLAAAALMLWHWAGRRQGRMLADRHVGEQVHKRTAGDEPAFDVRRAAAPANAMTDPWLMTGTAPVARKTGLNAIVLPGWLENVATPQGLAAGLAAILVTCALIFAFAGGIAASGALILLLGIGSFGLWLRLQKFRKTLAAQLPGFIDAMVRLITVGNSTQAAFQLAVDTTKAPLRGYLEGATGLMRAGMELDQALHQMARQVRIEEMYLLASILGLGVRYGGRADVLLERVANFMRDREQAQHELVAMSSETRLSAWVLGLLPVVVGSMIIMLNGSYFTQMWNDSTGQIMIFGAFGLQIFGVLLLYRLARIA